MIRGETHGRRDVAEFTVARVEPARIATDAARWGQQPRRELPKRRPKDAPRLSAIVAAAVPGADPELCEMLYETDATGSLFGVVVRDTATHRVLAKFNLEQLAHLVATTGQRGVLFESKG